MKRLMMIYNPRSSCYGRVSEEVLPKARGLKGWMVGKYEVADTDVDDNAARLAKLLQDGDLVVVVGGDGTATIAMNAVLLSRCKDVVFGVLGNGNFNDMARTFGTGDFDEMLEIVEGGGKGRIAEVWPLECLVNGEHWRWGMCYFTVGLFAEACAVFDEKENRRELRTGRKGLLYSVGLLAKWYFANRKKVRLGDFELVRGGKRLKCVGRTDYVAINGRSMAKMMRGGEWFLDKHEFRGETRSLRGFWGLMRLMAVSILGRVPGVETGGDVLEFERPSSVMVQGEGEYKRFENVGKIEVRKSRVSVRVIMGK